MKSLSEPSKAGSCYYCCYSVILGYQHFARNSVGTSVLGFGWSAGRLGYPKLGFYNKVC